MLRCSFLSSDIEGADKQDLIFPQNKNAQWIDRRHISLENTVDGKLTYPEFMADMEKQLTHVGVDRSLKAPNGEGFGIPTVAEAVDALKAKGWAMPMDVSQVTSGRSGDYSELMGRVSIKFQDYFDKLGDDPKWKRKLIETNMRTHKLSGEIVSLRQQEADEWLMKQITRPVDPPGIPEEERRYGLGLDRNELVVERVPSSVPGATTYERVDLVRTFLEHPNRNRLLTQLGNAGIRGGIKGLVNWGDNLGNDQFAHWGPGYSDMNRSHAMAQMVWTNVHSDARKRLNGLSASCSR